MKFLLVLSVCSGVYKACLPNSEMWPLYDNYYDCATAGYLNSMGLLQEFGKEKVNEDEVMISFECKKTPTEEARHYTYNQ